MIKDIIDWTFSGVWLKFALALIAMFVFVLFFGVSYLALKKSKKNLLSIRACLPFITLFT